MSDTAGSDTAVSDTTVSDTAVSDTIVSGAGKGSKLRKPCQREIAPRIDSGEKEADAHAGLKFEDLHMEN